jgi:hypothetical protein
MNRIAGLFALIATGIPGLGIADTIVLYSNDFETPNQALVNSCGNSLDSTPINTLWGTEAVVFQQVNTVEGLFIDDPGGLYSNPQGTGGQYAVGMLSTAADDKLGMTFDAQGRPFINVGLDLSGIDIQGCGGPFGSSLPIMHVSVVDAPGGSWSWTSPPLDETDLVGAAPPDQWTFEWTNLVAGLDITGATDGTVTVIFDLTQSGYAAFDNLTITASTEEGIVDSDLDGIADDSDNCVDIANEQQVDTDEDGIGDACDDCPLDPEPGDSDGDGSCDSDDLCFGDDTTGDGDSDGWCADSDCDDDDPDVSPDADEVCNGEDDDCDGVVPASEVDADADGFAPCDGDCDDDDDAIHPDADEICNGIDDDCDGVLPDAELDTDGDGFRACDDCDDADAAARPGGEEVCDDGIDGDCDGEVDPEAECPTQVDGCACDCESSIARGSGAPAFLGLLLLALRRRRPRPQRPRSSGRSQTTVSRRPGRTGSGRDRVDRRSTGC